MHTLVEADLDTTIEARVPVFDRFDMLHHLARNPAFLASFAHRGDLGIFAFVNEALRKLPSILFADRNDHYFDSGVSTMINDHASRHLVLDRKLYSYRPLLAAAGFARRHVRLLPA